MQQERLRQHQQQERPEQKETLQKEAREEVEEAQLLRPALQEQPVELVALTAEAEAEEGRDTTLVLAVQEELAVQEQFIFILTKYANTTRHKQRTDTPRSE